jgi:hydroxymethylpyrimidine/phosphomethylpyrimidine kinase
MPGMEKTLGYARVLTIAGSDSGGGAGIQADLKTFAALGCYGMSAITALTAQNTVGVRAIHAVPPEFLKAQIQAVVEDIGVDAVKIGMLHAPGIVEVVAWAIDHYRLPNVVLDPVMVATSGDALIAQETVEVLVRELFPRATVITPNLDEAALLLGRKISAIDELDRAAHDLLDMGTPAVLLKGGHLAGDEVVDVLLQVAQTPARAMHQTAPNQLAPNPAAPIQSESEYSRPIHLSSRRIASRNVHGTGCTLSSAIAAYLALGHPLQEAVAMARTFILSAIRYGAKITTGHGHGPLNHGFAPVPLHFITRPPSTTST